MKHKGIRYNIKTAKPGTILPLHGLAFAAVAGVGKAELVVYVDKADQERFEKLIEPAVLSYKATPLGEREWGQIENV